MRAAHPATLLTFALLVSLDASASPIARDNSASSAKWRTLLALAGQDLVTLCQGIEPKATQTFTALSTTITTALATETDYTTSITQTNYNDVTSYATDVEYTTTQTTSTLVTTSTPAPPVRRRGVQAAKVNSVVTAAFNALYKLDPQFVLQQCQRQVAPLTVSTTTTSVSTSILPHTTTQINTVLTDTLVDRTTQVTLVTTSTVVEQAVQTATFCPTFACPGADSPPSGVAPYYLVFDAANGGTRTCVFHVDDNFVLRGGAFSQGSGGGRVTTSCNYDDASGTLTRDDDFG